MNSIGDCLNSRRAESQAGDDHRRVSPGHEDRGVRRPIQRRHRQDLRPVWRRGKLEMITGGPHLDMRIEVFDDRSNAGTVKICDLSDDVALLGSYPVDSGMRLHVVDTSGSWALNAIDYYILYLLTWQHIATKTILTLSMTRSKKILSNQMKFFEK